MAANAHLADDLASEAADGTERPVSEEQSQQDPHGDDRGHDLVIGHRRGEQAHRQRSRAVQEEPEVSGVDRTRVRVGIDEEQNGIEERQANQYQEKHQACHVFADDHLPIADRGGQ